MSIEIQLIKKFRWKLNFLAEKKLSAEEVIEAKSCLGGTQTSKTTHILPDFQ